MNARSQPTLDFSKVLGKLKNPHLWEYEAHPRKASGHVAEATFTALQRPLDFPPLEAAVVPGDRVAIAVDPNVPELEEVLEGVIKALKQAGAGEVDVVLTDEASEQTIQSVCEKLGDQIRVSRHHSTERSSLRYLGPDEVAQPVYLNRWLVDADLVLPITAARLHDPARNEDMTGIFPAFSDSRARHRYHQQQQILEASAADRDSADTINRTGSKDMGHPDEPAWLLGVQIMLIVTANERGLAAQVLAGTPDAIRKVQADSRQTPDEFPPAAPLVIASLDGGPQQQSWSNAARAVTAAARYTLPSGTIVLWSEIDHSPAKGPGRPPSATLDQATVENATPEAEAEAEDTFPEWNEDEAATASLARVAEEYRLLIHCRLDQETIEALGYGAIDSDEQLNRLSQTFEACGILRAAQFAGAPYLA